VCVCVCVCVCVFVLTRLCECMFACVQACCYSHYVYLVHHDRRYMAVKMMSHVQSRASLRVYNLAVHAATLHALCGRYDLCAGMLLILENIQRVCGFTGLLSQKDTLTSLCARMSTDLVALQTLIDAIITSINTMNTRTTTATARCAADYDALLSALAHARARVLREYRARSRACEKWLDEKAEEADTVSTQLAAVSAMCTAHSKHAAALLHSVGHMSMLAQSINGDGARLCVPVSMLTMSALTGMSTVWRELPDGAVSSESGRGMKSFVKGAAVVARNVVVVYPRVFSGVFAEYVKPVDACLMLRDDTGSLIDVHVIVDRVDDGGLQLVYAVTAECVNKLSVSVTVCGVAIGHDVTVQSGYDAIYGTSHVASYDVGTEKSGMGVNADGSMMAVSFNTPLHQVHVFRLALTFERVCVIGRYGTGPTEFNYPKRLCFTDDSILVCDWYINRVQQLTVAGEYLSSFTVKRPVSIAVHGDMVAVGTDDGPIELHSRATGERIRRFGSRGNGPGQIGGYHTSIRFTADGTCLLVAEYDNRRLSLFTVDGVFMKHIGAGALADGWRDVSFGAGGEIIVADRHKHRICVFSSDGDTLIKTWGSHGTAAGQFIFPTALAVSGSYLYVIDDTRVHVFE
jgi:hypothetical protein